MYRKFTIINGAGETFYLTDKKQSKVFGDEPQGLGTNSTLSFIRLGDEQLLTYKQFGLNDINLTLLFYADDTDEQYRDYTRFINHLSKKPLYLTYEIPSNKTVYRREVEVASIQKTQSVNNVLSCPIVLTPLTFWEDNEAKQIVLGNGTTGDSKKYPLNRPFEYAGLSLNGIEIVSNSLLETPFELTIDGLVTDPQYILYDESDNVYGVGKFNGTFNKVYVNSNSTHETIELLDVADRPVVNPYGYQEVVFDYANADTTFLKFKGGKSKLAVVVGNSFNGTVKIEWRDRYATV